MLRQSFLLFRSGPKALQRRGNLKKIIPLLLMVIVLQLRFQALSAQPIVKHDSAKSEELFSVIRSANVHALKTLLEKGADPNDSLDNYSALMMATLNGSVEEMKILIEHGAKVNYLNKYDISALWLAVPDWDKTMLLLDHGADAQHKIEEYGVLVKLAAMPGTIKLFRLLIDKGADVKKSAPDNYLLYNAASSGDTAILAFLLRCGLNANDSVSYGDYPINAALGFNSFDALKMLVENGANVNVKPMGFGLDAFNGFTPLMFAAISNDRKSLLYLLDHGADPNLKSKLGYTALMVLEQAEQDDPEMTQALIRHGAVPSEKRIDGTDALYYAQKKGDTRSVDLLKKHSDK